MNIKKIISITFAVTAISMSSYAQSEDDSFLDFYKQRTAEFKDWRSKANAEFSEYLAAAWEEFLVQRGKVDPIGPVPEEPVYYNPEDAVQSALHGFPVPGIMAVPAYPVPEPAGAADYDGGTSVSVDFFGIEERIPFLENMRLARIGATEQDASRGWQLLSDSDYMEAVDAFNAMREKYSLSDWALYTAVKKYTDAVYIEEYVNEKVLTQMFLLNQMQYKARAGAAGGSLILLLPYTGAI